MPQEFEDKFSAEVLEPFQEMQKSKIAFVQRYVPQATDTQALFIMIGGWFIINKLMRTTIHKIETGLGNAVHIFFPKKKKKKYRRRKHVR